MQVELAGANLKLCEGAWIGHDNLKITVPSHIYCCIPYYTHLWNFRHRYVLPADLDRVSWRGPCEKLQLRVHKYLAHASVHRFSAVELDRKSRRNICSFSFARKREKYFPWFIVERETGGLLIQFKLIILCSLAASNPMKFSVLSLSSLIDLFVDGHTCTSPLAWANK